MRSSATVTLSIVLLAVAQLGCEDPPPPAGMGALILGVRTILPPPEERVLSGGAGERLEGLERLRVRALSVAVVHRDATNDPATERVIEVHGEPTDLDLLTTLEDGSPRQLAFLNVPAGFIHQIRIRVDSVTLTSRGEEFAVHTPSAGMAGYKIEPVDAVPFEILSGERHGAQILLNPFEELIRNRGQGFILKPVVEAELVDVHELLGFAADRLVVGFDPTLSEGAIDAINAEVGTTIVRRWVETNYCVLRLPIELSVEAAIRHYRSRGDVRFALPDNLVSTFADPPPDDPVYLADNQPRLLQGHFYGAEGAWQLAQGSHEVVVAVIDDGFNLDHRDIIENVWINEAEIPPSVIAAAGGTLADLDAVAPFGVITFADLDAVVARLRDDGDPTTDPLEICGQSNSPPLDRCNVSDLVSGIPGGVGYGWEDGVDGDPFPGCPSADPAVVCALDDVVGWSFRRGGINRPSRSEHGTWMASILGAVGNNGLAIAGAAWRVRIMTVQLEPLELAPPEEEFRAYRSSVVDALRYVTRNGAHVANLSGGMVVTSDSSVECGLLSIVVRLSPEGGKLEEAERLLREEIRDVAGLERLVFVLAAGNCAPDFPFGVGPFLDLDRSQTFEWPGTVAGPDGRDFPSIIRVGNLGTGGTLFSSSAFGPRFVDIASPGEDHVGLNLNFTDTGTREVDGLVFGRGSPITGTSPAAALTSGLAALVLDASPELRGDGCRIADRILRTSRPDGTLAHQIGGGRVMDAFATVSDTAAGAVRSCD